MNIRGNNNYHRKLDSSANFQLNFLPSSKQKYAFDYLGSNDHGIFSTNEFYPKSANGYDFLYKSVETLKTDYVKVDFSNYNDLKDSVIFKDRYGIKLKLSKDNILTFTGTQKPDTNYIYAYDNSGQRIGKLFVYTYKKQTKNVVLVSVNNAKIDKSITASGLNKIFKPAVTEFIISEDKIEIPDLETFTHGGSNWHSVYNSDQKLVLETYDKNIKDDNFYLFFVDNVLDKKDSLGTSVSGYMPRGYNCGFIYEGGSLHTVAHELGHGVGNLEHVFENSNNSGKTANLMDYASGEELWHFQWDQIQDPSRVWMKWNKAEEEGEENQIFDDYICTMKFLNEFCYAYLNGKPLTYESDGLPFGHSCYILFLSMSTNAKINVKIKKSFENFIPKSKNLIDYNEYLDIDFYDINYLKQQNFEEIIDNYERRERQYLNDIKNANIDVDKLLDILAILPVNAYSKIDINTRINILQKLSNKLFITQSYFGCVNDEQIIVNLLKTTPNINEYHKILRFIFVEGDNIYFKLKSGLDGDNFTEFIYWLYFYWTFDNESTLTDVRNNYNKHLDKTFIWDDDSDSWWPTKGYQTLNANGLIHITYFVPNDICQGTYDEITQSFGPQEFVVLKLQVIPDFFKKIIDDTNLRRIKNQCIIIPAFVFDAIISKINLSHLRDITNLTFSIKSFTIGISALSKATNLSYSKKLWILLGLLSDSYTIATTNSQIYDQIKKKIPPKYRKAFEGALSLTDISSAMKALKSNNKTYDEYFEILNGFWSTYKDSELFTEEEKEKISEVIFIDKTLIKHDEN